jgi:hypothetical protein
MSNLLPSKECMPLYDVLSAEKKCNRSYLAGIRSHIYANAAMRKQYGDRQCQQKL